MLRGWAGPRLLDSYESERRPVAAANVARSLQPSELDVQAGLARDLGYVYASPDAQPPAGPFRPRAVPGARAPHVWLTRNGRPCSTVDLSDTTFTLLTGPDGDGWQRAAAVLGDVPLSVLSVGPGRDLEDPTGTFPPSYNLAPDGAVLIRPDGHIATHHHTLPADPEQALMWQDRPLRSAVTPGGDGGEAHAGRAHAAHGGGPGDGRRLLRPGEQASALKRCAEDMRAALRMMSIQARDWQPPCEDEEDMERRTFAKVLGAGALAPAYALERLAAPRQVGASLLDAAEELTSAYASRYYQALPNDLMGLVRPHLNRLQALTALPTLPTWRRRLNAMLSDAAAFAGWLSLDAARLADGRSYFALARESAREAGDAALHALAVASLGLLHTNLPGADSGTVLWLLRQADAQLPSSAPAEARAWIRMHAAKEYAAAGDAHGYHRYAEAADVAAGGASRSGFFSPGGWFSDVVSGEWRRDCQTRALAYLADADAETALLDALARGGDARRQATLHSTLSGYLVRHRQPEEAAREALAALDSARGLPLWRERIRDLRAQLDPWADLPAVRDLDEALA